ncbi:MAG: type II secretion system secretin GspD [Pseudomonadota bacterium]
MSTPKHGFTSSAALAAGCVLLAGCAHRAPAESAQPSARWAAPAPAAQPQPQPPVAAPAPAPVAAAPQVVEYFDMGASGKGPVGEQQAQVKQNQRRIDLNFNDADVRSVAATVLGELLKLNYAIDPAVQGKITLRTGSPIFLDSALPALEAALSTVSAAVIVQEGIVKVVPMEAASQQMRAARRFDPERRLQPGFAVEIVPLRYVGAKELQRVLDSFAPKGSILQADDVHNHLVIAGTSQDRAAIVQTIAGFDLDGMQGMSFALYKVEQATPEQLVAELRQIFQPPMELITQRVRLVPIGRLQSILGISKYRADLELLESWVHRLDGAVSSGERRLHVYNVQNGSAKDLARSLQLVMTGDQAAAAPSAFGGAPLAAPAAQPGAAGAPAAAPAPMPAAPFAPAAAQAGLGGNGMRIVANEENNSLLVYGTDQEYRGMRDALRQLDVMPRQVMIEAMVAEVTLGDKLNYGVQWMFNSGHNNMTLSTANSGAVGPSFPGFSYVYSGVANARLVLSALQSQTDVKILSSPKLAVLNNQKAELLVGDQIPVLTQTSQATTAAGAPIITSIQMRDTGISLEVTPRISENGNVVLDVTQEVSDVTSTTTSAINSPTIQRRRLHSTIATRDGATVALGGLIREIKSNGDDGVPLLSNLPLVGNLFKTTSKEVRRTELIVLLVPHVMREQDETQAVADALLERMPSSAELTRHAAPVQPRPQP